MGIESPIRFPLWPSGESEDHTEGPRRLFGYFLAGEKVSTPFFEHCKFAVSLQIVENVSFLPAFLFSHGYAMTASPRGKPRALRADAYPQQFDKLEFEMTDLSPYSHLLVMEL